MRVIEIDRLRFHVISSTEAGTERLVDMGEFEGSGCCSCWFFARQIKPQMEHHILSWQTAFGVELPRKPGTYVPEERHECPHILAVKRYIANKLVQAIRLRYADDNSKGQAT